MDWELAVRKLSGGEFEVATMPARLSGIWECGEEESDELDLSPLLLLLLLRERLILGVDFGGFGRDPPGCNRFGVRGENGASSPDIEDFDEDGFMDADAARLSSGRD